MKTRPETDQKPSACSVTGKYPKTHVKYWEGRLIKRTYSYQGATREVPTWSVRLGAEGRQHWFSTGQANRAQAAQIARDIYQSIRANGLEATVAKFKAGDGDPVPTDTVGVYLKAVEESGELRQRTFLNYQNCLHTILAGMFGIKPTRNRFDYRKGGNLKWRKRLNAVRLNRITSQRVERWQKGFVAAAGKSPVAVASAKRTANTYIRCARSLFSRALIKRLRNISTPSPLPFDGVELFDQGSMRYISRIDARSLIAAAKSELKGSDDEAYKAFLLALFAGMCKAEIDLAEWQMCDWNTCTIRLEATEFLHLKAEARRGEISVDGEVMAELKAYMPQTPGPFIIASNRAAKPDPNRQYYRAEPVFKRLYGWLRSKGIAANKPLHELRKEIGALIATEHGIYAASTFVRHSDITTTARHYAAHKHRITVGLGKFLSTEITAANQQSASN